MAMKLSKDEQPAARDTSHEPKLEIVFVLGPPGSGKGKHCKRLASEEAANIYHLSVGDYLRDISRGNVAIEKGMLGDMPYDDFRAHLEQSKLIPGPTVARILAHKIWKEYDNGQRLFVIDGYPRQIDAADEFEKAVAKPRSVVEFICTPKEAKKRFLERKRGIDDEAMFERRYAEYVAYSVGIRARYHETLRSVVTIGEKEKVYQRVKGLISSVTGPPWGTGGRPLATQNHPVRHTLLCSSLAVSTMTESLKMHRKMRDQIYEKKFAHSARVVSQTSWWIEQEDEDLDLLEVRIAETQEAIYPPAKEADEGEVETCRERTLWEHEEGSMASDDWVAEMEKLKSDEEWEEFHDWHELMMDRECRM